MQQHVEEPKSARARYFKQVAQRAKEKHQSAKEKHQRVKENAKEKHEQRQIDYSHRSFIELTNFETCAIA